MTPTHWLLIAICRNGWMTVHNPTCAVTYMLKQGWEHKDMIGWPAPYIEDWAATMDRMMRLVSTEGRIGYGRKRLIDPAFFDVLFDFMQAKANSYLPEGQVYEPVVVESEELYALLEEAG